MRTLTLLAVALLLMAMIEPAFAQIVGGAAGGGVLGGLFNWILTNVLIPIVAIALGIAGIRLMAGSQPLEAIALWAIGAVFIAYAQTITNLIMNAAGGGGGLG